MVFEQLAQLLLDSDWTYESLEHRLSAVYRPTNRRSVFRRVSKSNPALLAASISLAFPYPPSRTRLTEFLRLSPGSGRGLRYSEIQRAILENQLDGSQMRQSVAATLGWKYPPIGNLRELSDCLGTLDKTLNWLTKGPQGYGAGTEHYRVHVIAKRSGGVRLIEAPKARLKRIQREILNQILNQLPTHTAAHGFVRQRSTLTHVQPHVGQAWILRMDLEDFFPSIDGARIFGLFRSLGYPYEVTQSLTNLTTSVLGTETIRKSLMGNFGQEASERMVAELARLYFRRHLPQGAPTSPALANLVAYRFDCRLTGLANAYGANYSRYGDDLLFSSPTIMKRSLIKMADQVASIAWEEGFRVRHRKTAMIPNSQRQTAVGIVLNHRPNLVRHEYDLLKAILYNCVRFGPQSQNRSAHDHFAAHLLGRIHWLRSLHSAHGEKLLQLYQRIEWTTG